MSWTLAKSDSCVHNISLQRLRLAQYRRGTKDGIAEREAILIAIGNGYRDSTRRPHDREYSYIYF